VLVQISRLDQEGLPVAARSVLDSDLHSNTLRRDAWHSSEGRLV
jgi:hypothetical protein